MLPLGGFTVFPTMGVQRHLGEALPFLFPRWEPIATSKRLCHFFSRDGNPSPPRRGFAISSWRGGRHLQERLAIFPRWDCSATPKAACHFAQVSREESVAPSRKRLSI
jgi:hypothetical protein